MAVHGRQKLYYVGALHHNFGTASDAYGKRRRLKGDGGDVDNGHKHVVVVCPKVVVQNWRSEIANWSFLKVVAHRPRACALFGTTGSIQSVIQVEVLNASDTDCLYRIFTLRNMDVLLASYDQLQILMERVHKVW